MTYCVGVKLEEGLIFASDSRTHAGVDNYAKFCKMTVFERRRRSCAGAAQLGWACRNAGDHQCLLRQRALGADEAAAHLEQSSRCSTWRTSSSDAMRDIERRDGPHSWKSAA